MTPFSTDLNPAQPTVASGRTAVGIEEPLQRLLRISAAPCLLVLVISLAVGTAAAQTPPDQVIAYQDSLGVFVNYSHCPSSEYQNCYANFGLYRSPSPGFNQGPVKICWSASGNSTFDTCQDNTAQSGQTYTYKLCTGGAALSDGSNCATSNSVTVPVKSPPPPAPTVTLTAASTSITKGQETELFWTSTNATSLNLQPNGGGKIASAGSAVVAPGQTTIYTLTGVGPGGKATANVTINVPCPTPWAPPANLTGVGGLPDVPLKWSNPNTGPGQSCPAPPTQVLIYRMGSNGWQQLASLDKASNGGVLPVHYTDNSLLQPHTGYQYEVCEGGSPNWQNPVNCLSPHGVQHGSANSGIVTWGANPVLSATRAGANSVKLQLALDQYTVTSVVVTRQGSDDPCRQGGTLGNGLQGCSTVSSNGLGGSPANTVTVYSWNESQASQYPPGFQNSQSAPFVINLPDDTSVKPGVEYYYVAQVTWLWAVEQDSITVTVPSFYATATSQRFAGGLKSIQPNGSAPPPPPPSQSRSAVMMSPSSRSIAPAMVTTNAAAPAPPPGTAGTPMLAATSTTATPMLQAGRPMLAEPATSSAPTNAQPVSASRAATTLPNSSNILARIKELQQKPHDPQALYELGKAYCASRARNTGVSYMYMALLLAEQKGNLPLAAQIKATLAGEGVGTR